MKYDTRMGNETNWIIEEDFFEPEYAGKFESVFCQGNGYLGLRAAYEENYARTVRGLYVAGTFNRFHESEVTELPNAADVTELQIWVNGKRFEMTCGKLITYSRTLNLKNGHMVRQVLWESPDGLCVNLKFERFVSLSDFHVIAQQVEITPQNGDAEIRIVSGINGRMTNSGSQHFAEREKSIADKCYMQACYQTTQSGLWFLFNTAHRFWINGSETEPECLPVMDRRLIQHSYRLKVNRGQTCCMEKISNVYTDRDQDCGNEDIETRKNQSRKALAKSRVKGFHALLSESEQAWSEKVWSRRDIRIKSKREFDQLALRFAIYHLTIMAPVHDNRMNIGAKGLSGEGYKGHTFWDTEVFMLPYFMYTAPEEARSLLEYRYYGLKGAREKAKEYGYEGAMYPWESAWIDDGEVTPKVGGADIITGHPIPILTGELEIHISCDVALGVAKYYECTGDTDFMERCGYEIILDTAKFWQSRLEWNDKFKRYEITDVIGPDEYKEHVSNNAATNYMVHWNLSCALACCKKLKEEKPKLYEALDEKLDLAKACEKWEKSVGLIYLPKPNEDGIIPQDDTYLSLPEIDLTKYKESEKIGSIYDDYNMEQIVHMQVSKQADLLMLLYQFEELFSLDIRKKNFYYYERHCLHDSSLSLAIHSVFANDLGERKQAYDLFRRAGDIDLGPNMKSSDMGIHAAAMGGLWQTAVFGFGGIRARGSSLRINPSLPENWQELEFQVVYRGVRLEICVTQEQVCVSRIEGREPLTILHGTEEYQLEEKIIWKN